MHSDLARLGGFEGSSLLEQKLSVSQFHFLSWKGGSLKIFVREITSIVDSARDAEGNFSTSEQINCTFGKIPLSF